MLLSLRAVVLLGRVRKQGMCVERGTWYPVLFRCPSPEVGHLTSF